FFPANTMLGIWGDFDAAQMRAQVERLFADWTAKQDPVPEFPKVRTTPTPGVWLAEKKDAPRTYFAIGQLGGIANHKDYAALQVMGLVLNRLQARITQHLQTQLGTANPALTGAQVEDVNAAWGAGFERPGT